LPAELGRERAFVALTRGRRYGAVLAISAMGGMDHGLNTNCGICELGEDGRWLEPESSGGIGGGPYEEPLRRHSRADWDGDAILWLGRLEHGAGDEHVVAISGWAAQEVAAIRVSQIDETSDQPIDSPHGSFHCSAREPGCYRVSPDRRGVTGSGATSRRVRVRREDAGRASGVSPCSTEDKASGAHTS
jgi:hypothetical protein